MQTLLFWGTSRPHVIVGKGSKEGRVTCLREMIQIAKGHLNTVVGVLRPCKQKPLVLSFLLPVLNFLEWRPKGCPFSSSRLRVRFEGKEGCKFNMERCGHPRGNVVLLDVSPFKNSTNIGSTHSCQFGRRAFK